MKERETKTRGTKIYSEFCDTLKPDRERENKRRRKRKKERRGRGKKRVKGRKE